MIFDDSRGFGAGGKNKYNHPQFHFHGRRVHGRARYSIISYKAARAKGVVTYIDSTLRGAGALRLRFCTLQAATRQHGPQRDDTMTVEHDYP